MILVFMLQLLSFGSQSRARTEKYYIGDNLKQLVKERTHEWEKSNRE